MQYNNFIKRLIGFTGLFVSIIILCNYSDFILLLIDFGEKYLSQDNYLQSRSILMIKIFSAVCILLLITLSVFFIFNMTKFLYSNTIEFFQISKNNICRKKRLDLLILIIAVLFGIFEIYYVLTFGQTINKSVKPYTSAEGPMEKYYAFLLLFSIFLLIISIIRINKELFFARTRRKIYLILTIISVIIIPILGEEISWGQQIFHWESFGVFNEFNVQNETNIHNFIPPSIYEYYIYPIVGFGSLLVLFLLWLNPLKRKSYFFNLFIPHPSLFFLIILMAIYSIFGSETYEQLLSIFILLYSFRIYMCLTFPNVDLLPKET